MGGLSQPCARHHRVVLVGKLRTPLQSADAELPVLAAEATEGFVEAPEPVEQLAPDRHVAAEHLDERRRRHLALGPEVVLPPDRGGLRRQRRARRSRWRVPDHERVGALLAVPGEVAPDQPFARDEVVVEEQEQVASRRLRAGVARRSGLRSTPRAAAAGPGSRARAPSHPASRRRAPPRRAAPPARPGPPGSDAAPRAVGGRSPRPRPRGAPPEPTAAPALHQARGRARAAEVRARLAAPPAAREAPRGRPARSPRRSGRPLGRHGPQGPRARCARTALRPSPRP